jgi:hypothetical protein
MKSLDMFKGKDRNKEESSSERAMCDIGITVGTLGDPNCDICNNLNSHLSLNFDVFFIESIHIHLLLLVSGHSYEEKCPDN